MAQGTDPILVARAWPSNTGMQCVAVCCSVLQCVAVCCSVLRCVVVCCGVSQCVAVCCRLLQCVVLCCGSKNRFALGGKSISVQYRYVCCSVLHVLQCAVLWFKE